MSIGPTYLEVVYPTETPDASPLSTKACCSLDELRPMMAENTSAATVEAESVRYEGPCHENCISGVWAIEVSLIKYSLLSSGLNGGIGYFCIGSKPLLCQSPKIFSASAKASSCFTSPQMVSKLLLGK